MRGVSKFFGQKAAVDGLDLCVDAGKICGFIGPNGAGKTTTIRMILAILKPDAGTLRVLGRPSAEEARDRIGYLPEERGVYRKMRVLPFIHYMARLKGVPPSGLDERIRGWLDRVGLADCAAKRCEELSKGMQQKVQFIAAVIHEPDLLVLDEPFSGLDPVAARLLRDLIVEQNRRGRTVIFSTHVMQQAEQLCDQIFMIHRGKKVLDGRLADIQARFDARRILVEPLDGAASPSAFQGIAGVERVDRLTPGGAVMHLELTEGADASDVVRAAVARCALRRVEIVRPTLEEIFLQLVDPARPAAGGDQDRTLEAAGA